MPDVIVSLGRVSFYLFLESAEACVFSDEATPASALVPGVAPVASAVATFAPVRSVACPLALTMSLYQRWDEGKQFSRHDNKNFFVFGYKFNIGSITKVNIIDIAAWCCFKQPVKQILLTFLLYVIRFLHTPAYH